MVKSLEASISMNNKQMDESGDVSASVASPADYIPYVLQSPARSFSFDIN